MIDMTDMSKIELVCSPSSASHQPSTELRQNVGPAWQLLLCFCQGAIGVLVKQHPGLLSPQGFEEGLIRGHRVRTYPTWLHKNVCFNCVYMSYVCMYVCNILYIKSCFFFLFQLETLYSNQSSVLPTFNDRNLGISSKAKCSFNTLSHSRQSLTQP